MPPSPSAHPASSTPWPQPSEEALNTSAALHARIVAEIVEHQGWMSFARYQECCLYTPHLGYYARCASPFGPEGDFVTAPELSGIFGKTLARQVAQIMDQSAAHILEAGAGSGRLAADILQALEALNALPERYAILELSAALRSRQEDTLREQVPHLLPRVVWLDRLPEQFSGCLLANELLDALPVHAFRQTSTAILERGIGCNEQGKLIGQERCAPPFLDAAVRALDIPPEQYPWEGEIGLAAAAWVAAWGTRLGQGALLLIDYGLPRHELLHPQRNGGTLRCHYRQRVHQDFFSSPGLSDITSHVDFSGVALAAHDAGLEILGYAPQASFLINCGLGEHLAASPPSVSTQGAVRILTAPGEMGELFKVLAVGRGIQKPLLGFVTGDRTHAL
jgi:SAM-dependent MidA family methyltransferase